MFNIQSTRLFTWFIALCALFPIKSFGQAAVSNEGTDFWVGYMDHANGTSSSMSLYITSDVNTAGTVSVPGAAWSTSYTVAANTTTVVPIPSATAFVGCSDCISNLGIHVVSDDPVVVYAHIYFSPRSDATLVLPVPALGKEYWVMSYPQGPGTSGNRSVFMIIAVEDNTTVEITPSSNTVGGALAGVPFNVTLNTGEIYQLESLTDLTGTKITSQGGSGSCKRIAVFAGSTYNKIGCAGASTGDNLYEQLYPVTSWGKEFVTAPFKTKSYDVFRVLAGFDTTIVNFNGIIADTLNAGQSWDTMIGTSNKIVTDKPVSLAQFMITENCDGVTGDPSLLIVSPVEQTLDSITVYSSPFMAITGEYINVIMKTSDTATFTLDGLHVPFVTCPYDTLYSYAQNTVTSGNHTLLADSGFIASAYGMGSLESYAYCAGANVKNLQMEIYLTSNGIGNVDSICNGSEVIFSPFTSYTPASWLWYFGDGDTTSLSDPHHIYPDTGTYYVSLVTELSGVVGCGSFDSTSTAIHVVTLPDAGFITDIGCVGETTLFTDTSDQGGSPLYFWNWNFGDGDTAMTQNPGHIYANSGTYTVSVFVKTNLGCIDTVSQTVFIKPAPPAFAGNDTLICKGSAAQLMASGGVSYVWSPATDLSSDTIANPVASPINLITYTVTVTDTQGCTAKDVVTVEPHVPVIQAGTDQSICPGETATLNGTGGVTYSWSPANFLIGPNGKTVTVKPDAETKFTVDAIDGYGCTGKDSMKVYFHGVPVPGFTSDPVSGPWPLVVEFTNTSSGATTYYWDFGDGDTSSTPVPTHIYEKEGSFEVLLIAVSENGCRDTVTYQYIVTDNTNLIAIPNVFSPGSDGANDLFNITNVGYSEMNGEIYNRWGTLISKVNFISDGWNGKNNTGKDVPDGTYFYIVNALGHDKQWYSYHGTVTVVR